MHASRSIEIAGRRHSRQAAGLEVMAVRSVVAFLALSLAIAVGTPALAADAEARAQFERIIDELNDNSFKSFLASISRPAMLERIYARRIIATPVRDGFERDFANVVQSMYTESFPRSDTDIIGKVVAFEQTGGSGRAVVRFSAGGYRYSYHVYELAVAGDGRLAIVDWADHYAGSRFSDAVGNSLAMAMPGKPVVRQMVTIVELSEGQAFQVGELFKAVRDRKTQRYFQIHDDLDEVLRKDELIVRLTAQMAILSNDRARYEQAIEGIRSYLPADPLQSLTLATYDIGKRRFEDAIAELDRLGQALGVVDGVIESFKASAAMALGDFERAESLALQATAAEPTLELAWWTLLRVRTAAGDYSGALEPLARLADDFGQDLGPERLAKDRFLGVLASQQAYIDWRASR